MDIYRIDLRKVRTRAALHSVLSSVLPLPDYYGNNLDALFDVLTEWSGNVAIEFVTNDIVEEKLGGYYNAFLAMLDAAGAENPALTFTFRNVKTGEPGQEGEPCCDKTAGLSEVNECKTDAVGADQTVCEAETDVGAEQTVYGEEAIGSAERTDPEAESGSAEYADYPDECDDEW